MPINTDKAEQGTEEMEWPDNRAFISSPVARDDGAAMMTAAIIAH